MAIVDIVVNEDPYELLRAAHPLLANVTKDNLTQYLIHASTWARYPELLREDAIIEDPYLEPLSHVIGDAIARCFPDFVGGRGVYCYSVLRHYCFDQALKTKDPAIRQVVVVGNTLDTRAFRIEGLDNCTFFEMHLNEELMHYKEQVLAEIGAEPKVKRRVVFCTHFHDDGWQNDLLAAGFDTRKPTCWIIESTLPFIKQNEMMPLLSGIDFLSVPHSQIVTERFLGGGFDLETDEDKQVSLLVHTALRYGEDGGVFCDLKWNVEIMMRRNQAEEYYGTMWDPVRFDRFRVTGEDNVGGAWFMPLFSKPE